MAVEAIMFGLCLGVNRPVFVSGDWFAHGVQPGAKAELCFGMESVLCLGKQTTVCFSVNVH